MKRSRCHSDYDAPATTRPPPPPTGGRQKRSALGGSVACAGDRLSLPAKSAHISIDDAAGKGGAVTTTRGACSPRTPEHRAAAGSST